MCLNMGLQAISGERYDARFLGSGYLEARYLEALLYNESKLRTQPGTDTRRFDLSDREQRVSLFGIIGSREGRAQSESFHVATA